MQGPRGCWGDGAEPQWKVQGRGWGPGGKAEPRGWGFRGVCRTLSRKERNGVPSTPPQAPPSLPERGLHMSLPLLSSASAGAGTSLRVLWKGERAAAPGPGAGGSSSSLEGELEGELGWLGSHSAGPRGAPGAWQLLPGRRAFCPLRSSPAFAASAGGRPRVTMAPWPLGPPPPQTPRPTFLCAPAEGEFALPQAVEAAVQFVAARGARDHIGLQGIGGSGG